MGMPRMNNYCFTTVADSIFRSNVDGKSMPLIENVMSPVMRIDEVLSTFIDYSPDDPKIHVWS